MGILKDEIAKGSKTVSQQLATHFREAIDRQKYKPNEKLPTTKEIINKFGVSTHTVRDAMGILASEGLVSMTPRKGTIVNLKYPFNGHGQYLKKMNAQKQFSKEPNKMATVGVFGLVSHVSALGNWDSFRVDSARGSMVECDKRGLAMINLPIYRDYSSEHYVDLAQSYKLDGVLWCNEDYSPLAKFSDANIPVVLMCRNQPSKQFCSTVCIDYYKAGCSLADSISRKCPEKPVVAVANLDYVYPNEGLYVNHFLNGLQNSNAQLNISIEMKSWGIAELTKLLDWLRSLPVNMPVVFICSYHLIGLVTHYKAEVQNILKDRDVYAISNREPNLQLLSCNLGFDPYIIYDDFSKLSSIGIQKLVTIMSGLLDDTTTMVEMPIKLLSKLGIGTSSVPVL